VLVVVLAALVVSYASSLRAFVDQRHELAALHAESRTRQARLDDLARQIDRWQDPAYVEAQARSRFGYVMPGEVSYVVIDGNGASTTPTARTRASTPGPPWWSTLWGSVAQVDRTDGALPGRPAPATTPSPSVTPSPTPTPEKTLRPNPSTDR